MTSEITFLSSPTFTTMSSYDPDSESRSRSSTLSTQTFSLVHDSDDEVVWDISSDYHSSDDISTESSLGSDEEDFVVLSRPHSPHPSRDAVSTPSPARPSSSSNASSLASDLARLSLNSSVSARKNFASPLVEDDSPPMTPVKARPSRRRRCAKKEARAVGLGSRPIVDDVSESADTTDREYEVYDSSMYQEAVKFITSFLQNPSAYESSSRLTFLQSLIIELGLASSSLPASLKSAKAVLKSQAFLNIREYLAVRSQGPDAVKQVMYPSRSALIKSIRKQPRNRASLDWVKEHGLQVLLVTAYRH